MSDLLEDESHRKHFAVGEDDQDSDHALSYFWLV